MLYKQRRFALLKRLTEIAQQLLKISDTARNRKYNFSADSFFRICVNCAREDYIFGRE